MARQTEGHKVRLEGVDKQPDMYSICLDTGIVTLMYEGWVDIPRGACILTIDDMTVIIDHITHDWHYWEDTVIDGKIAKGEVV